MLGGGGDEVSVMPVVYPCGMVIVSSLRSVLSVGSSSKPSHTYLPLSIFQITPYSIVFQEEEGEEAKTNQATGGKSQT